MIEAYWEIGKRFVEMQCGTDTSDYGKQLIKELSKKIIIDQGKGFDESNLRKMRQFYLCFQKRDAVRLKLTFVI